MYILANNSSISTDLCACLWLLRKNRPFVYIIRMKITPKKGWLKSYSPNNAMAPPGKSSLHFLMLTPALKIWHPKKWWKICRLQASGVAHLVHRFSVQRLDKTKDIPGCWSLAPGIWLSVTDHWLIASSQKQVASG